MYATNPLQESQALVIFRRSGLVVLMMGPDTSEAFLFRPEAVPLRVQLGDPRPFPSMTV